MSTIDAIEKLLTPVIAAEHMELTDLQYVTEAGRKVLRVFLDKEGGVTLSDCEHMSGVIGAVLDQSDVIPGSYVLEVSSPGLDRVLKKEKDFIRFKDHKTRITTYAPIDGQRHFLGRILSAGEGKVTIEDVTGRSVAIPLDKIAKARLEPEINEI